MRARRLWDAGATNVGLPCRTPVTHGLAIDNGGDGTARSAVPSLLIDTFASAAPWAAEDPLGAPSAAIALTAVTDVFAPVGASSSLRADVTSAAAGHRIGRGIGPLDLTDFSELRLWARSDQVADGSVSRPMRLRIEIGSVVLPIGNPANLWHRLVPIARPLTWEFLRVALDDLNPAVATAASAIRITVEDHTAIGIDPAMTVWFDELIACEPRLAADATAELLALLDAQFVLNAPVPARVFVPGAAEPAVPWIRVVMDDVAFCDRRTVASTMKVDFVDGGYRMRAESVAYDLRYRIEPVTADPADYVAIVDFIIDTLAHRRTLLVGGAECPLDRLPSTSRDRRGDAPVLRYVVAARTDISDVGSYTPVADVAVMTDVGAP